MDEDSYELIKKSYLEELKNENNKLKEELELLKKSKIIPQTDISIKDFENRVLLSISEESEKLYNKIKKDLEYLKDLNEKNITNLLSTTDDLEIKFNKTIQLMNTLVTLLNKTINKIENNNNDLKLSEELLNLKNGLILIKNYLDNINDFMNKLSILLSQINPSNLK